LKDRGPLKPAVGEPLALLSRLLKAGVVESELDMAVEALVGAASATAAVVLVGRGDAVDVERWHGFDGAQRDQVRPLLGADPVVPQQLKLEGEQALLVYVMPLGHGAHGAAAIAFDAATPARPSNLEAADHVVAILAAKLAEERRVAAMRSELSRAKRWFEITGTQLKILDRERQKFAAVVSQSDTFVLVVDAGRVVRWVNGALRDRLARPEEQRGDELQVDAIWDMLGVDVKLSGCPVTRVLGEGRVDHVESRQSYDGEVRSLYLTLLPIKGVRGETAEVLVMIQDLSDLDLLRRSEARYRLLFERSPDAMLMVDPDSGKILLANPAACALTAHPAEELAALTLEQLHEPGAWPAARDDYARLVDQESLERAEQRLRTRRGEEVVARVTATRFDLDGRPVNLLVLQDVTKQRQLELELQHSQKMAVVGRLAAGITHEFNNIMTVILAQSELLNVRAGGDPKLAEIAETTNKAAVRAALLTRKLLAFSRKEVVKTEVLDLNEVLRTIEGLLNNLLGERVTLHIEEAPAPALVLGARTQLEEIAINLAANARDAIMRDGNFMLQVSAGEPTGSDDEGEVILSARDDGIGMDSETQDRLFEPFFTTKAPHAGTGLGMSTIRRIVEHHAGSIEVQSTPDTGTLVRIALPRAQAPSWQPPVEAEPDLGTGQSERILLVDDEPEVRTTAAHLLRLDGYEVTVAASAEEALELCAAASEPYQLLLTDVVMPGMSGGELSVLVKRRYPETRIVFMSGYTNEEVVRAGVSSSEAEFIQKPFSRQMLSKVLRRVLGN
jgi:two-component system, cell cycle sensor histidine kinase and response regulator CckA